MAFNQHDTATRRPDIFVSAMTTGTLTMQGRCLVMRLESEAVATPLWPEGTTVADSTVARWIVLPENRGRAQLGIPVRLETGAMPTKGVAKDVTDRCPAPFFIVSTVPWYIGLDGSAGTSTLATAQKYGMKQSR